MLLTALVTVRPSNSKTAFVAATLRVIGDEFSDMPAVEKALSSSELLRLNAFAVPVSDFKTRASPPLPVTSTKLA